MATSKSIIKDFKLLENKIAEVRSNLHDYTNLPIGTKVKLIAYRGSGIFNGVDLLNGNKISVHLNDVNILPDEEEKEISGTFSRIKSGKVKPDIYGTNPVIVLQEGSTIYLSSALLLLLGVETGGKISFAGDANKTFVFKDDEEDSLVISKDQTIDSFEVYTALTHMTGGLEINSFSVSILPSSLSEMQGVRFYEISPRVVTSETSYTNNPYAVYEKPVSKAKSVEMKTSLLDEINALRSAGLSAFLTTSNPTPAKGERKGSKQDKKIDLESLDDVVDGEISEVTHFNPIVEL